MTRLQHIEKVKHCPVEYCEDCEFLEVEVTPEGLRYPICHKPFEIVLRNDTKEEQQT